MPATQTDHIAESARQKRPEKANGACQVFIFDEDRVRRVRDAMPPESVIQDVADTFKVLAHPTRIRIIQALVNEELCVCDLAQILGLSVSATSHQLQALRKMKLVRHRMDGKFAYYSVRERFVSALLEDALHHVGDGGVAG